MNKTMITREEAMNQATKEAEIFCNKHDTALYGNSFSEFRTITTQKFFDAIYNNTLLERIKSLEAQLANTKQLMCKQCKHFTEASEEDFESCTFDFDCRDDYKPASRFEAKETR